MGDFVSRFKVAYEQKVLPNEPWIQPALEAVGEDLLQRRVSFHDIAKSGALTYDEFAKCTQFDLFIVSFDSIVVVITLSSSGKRHAA